MGTSAIGASGRVAGGGLGWRGSARSGESVGGGADAASGSAAARGAGRTREPPRAGSISAARHDARCPADARFTDGGGGADRVAARLGGRPAGSGFGRLPGRVSRRSPGAQCGLGARARRGIWAAASGVGRGRLADGGRRGTGGRGMSRNGALASARRAGASLRRKTGGDGAVRREGGTDRGGWRSDFAGGSGENCGAGDARSVALGAARAGGARREGSAGGRGGVCAGRGVGKLRWLGTAGGGAVGAAIDHVALL